MSGVKLKLAAIFLHKCLHDVKCHVKNLSCPRKRLVIIGKASNSIYVHKLKSLERNIGEENHPWRALHHTWSQIAEEMWAHAHAGELRLLSADALLKTQKFADDGNTHCAWKVSWTKVTKLCKSWAEQFIHHGECDSLSPQPLTLSRGKGVLRNELGLEERVRWDF